MAQACPTILPDSTVSDLVNVIIPLAAVVLGYWLAQFANKREYLGDRIGEISQELERLLNVGSLYWRETSTGSKGSQEIAFEAEIQGRLHAINSLFEDVSTNFKDNKTNIARASISELRQVLTGGTFASDGGHSSSAFAISRSFSLASELRVQLHGCWRDSKWSLIISK